MKKPISALLITTTLLINSTFAQQKSSNNNNFTSETFSALKFRSIGPALTSGRIADFAVNPNNSSEYYVATASGGVWKTINAGTTYSPIFDGQGSYSIGCVTLAPSNPSIVWVGSGENNNQRSIAYGDGVYKSEDGGRSWKNMGLKNSEHISEIVVHPTDPNIIYVGAYGPLWSEGGERGVYKSTDGGATWTCVKSVSAYTGVNDLVMDPRNPNVLYAAFHQRMRKVFTYIGGGPESAIYKTTDGGATWKKLEGGLPSGDIGRMGLAQSPVNPNILYTVVEAKEDKGGIYRSMDNGASWEKRNGFYTSGNYYQEITCDPVNENKIFITDTYYKVSIDGGKTVSNLGENNKHIDNHCIWIDPKNTKHLLVGCDGGVYETYDNASTWDYKENLPIIQFYKVATDNDYPFYQVHGGTQDNFSLGGPSRNTSASGISNEEWYVTSIGDGFESQIDQSNPNIVYAQSQYGGLVRFDKKNGEYLSIRPIEKEGEPAYRWNWDAPLFISHHNNSRLYFGANKVFRTDDKGNSWKVISPDLSRQVDRNKMEVMGRVWSMDAIAKNGSTDIFGQTTTIAESKLDENVLWVGTDDGLIQLTTDGGKNWTKIDNIPGVPKMSYVHQIVASAYNKNTAYACFNHHRYGDFKPYVFKTTDAGKTWKAIQANLPARGSVYSIAEDHVDPNLLFVGTEFGIFFSNNGGTNWIQLKAGLPTIAVRDIEIQRRENDLVIATFGRGFYILDDYSVLRNFKKEDQNKSAVIFPVKEGLMFNKRFPLGLRDKGHLGSSYYAGQNPELGVHIYFYVKDELKTIKAKRKELEKTAIEKKQTIKYPTADSMRLEDTQVEPYYLFTITDAAGKVVRYLKADPSNGLQKIVWDFRYNNPEAVKNRHTPAPDALFDSGSEGAMVAPGTYNVSIAKYEDGVLTQLGEAQKFSVKLYENSSIPSDLTNSQAFYTKVSELRKALDASAEIFGEMQERISQINNTLTEMPAPAKELLAKVNAIRKESFAIDMQLNGDASLRKREFEVAPSISDRVYGIMGSIWNSTAPIPQIYTDSYAVAYKQLKECIAQMKKLNSSLEQVEKEMDGNKAPWTVGRWPTLD